MELQMDVPRVVNDVACQLQSSSTKTMLVASAMTLNQVIEFVGLDSRIGRQLSSLVGFLDDPSPMILSNVIVALQDIAKEMVETETRVRVVAPQPKPELPTLDLVPLSDDIWALFLMLHNSQGSPMDPRLPRPKKGIWVCRAGLLVVGCCIYDTDGPMLMAEHLVSNPHLSNRTRFAAMEFALDALRAVAAAEGKYIVAHPSKKHLGRFLARRGFVYKQVVTLVADPRLSVPERHR